jgi:hypothetical protein
MKKTVIIRVSPRLAEKLKEKYFWFNENIAKNCFKKEIAFTDFTDVLANGLDEVFEYIFGSKLLLFPIKRGRRAKRITFETDIIPI